jgi:hypothetical protein
MRIIFLVFSLFVTLKAEDYQNKNLLTTNLLSLVPVGNIPFASLEYQRYIDENSSFGGEIALPLFKGVSGIRGGLEYRYYPLASALKKLYLSPRLLYTDLNDSVEEETFQVVTLGLVLGWNFQGRHFSFNLGFGLDYNTGPSLQDAELEEGQSNTTPHLRLSMGWSW